MSDWTHSKSTDFNSHPLAEGELLRTRTLRGCWFYQFYSRSENIRFQYGSDSLPAIVPSWQSGSKRGCHNTIDLVTFPSLVVRHRWLFRSVAPILRLVRVYIYICRMNLARFSPTFQRSFFDDLLMNSMKRSWNDEKKKEKGREKKEKRRLTIISKDRSLCMR